MKIYLFDIDGTLTPARQPMSKDFAEFFIEFCKKNVVYLCTGSDWEKVEEQVPHDVLAMCYGIFTCSGNAYWTLDDNSEPQEVPRHRQGFDPPESLIDDLNLFLESSDYPVKTSNHIEKRTL